MSENSLQNKYDKICSVAYVNLFTLTKEKDEIVFMPFNSKDKNHLFLLGVAKGLAGVQGKTIKVDVGPIALWRLNRNIDKDCRIKRVGKEQVTNIINPDSVLEFMLPYAQSFCGEKFQFKDIYDEFYSRKKAK